ncbi:MAG: hypothetical protein QXX95_06780 [Nitrososphaerales archaeon]|jgi:hypothetical protein
MNNEVEVLRPGDRVFILRGTVHQLEVFGRRGTCVDCRVEGCVNTIQVTTLLLKRKSGDSKIMS